MIVLKMGEMSVRIVMMMKIGMMRRMALMLDEDGGDEDVFVVTFQPPINGSTQIHKSTDYQDDINGVYHDDDDADDDDHEVR